MRSRANPKKNPTSPNKVVVLRIGKSCSVVVFRDGREIRRRMRPDVRSLYRCECVCVSRVLVHVLLVCDCRIPAIPVAVPASSVGLEVESIAGNVRILIKLERVLIGRRSEVFENGFVHIFREELLDDVVRKLVDVNVFVILQNFNL